MANKKKNRSTQKVVKFVEASNITPAYKTASSKTNTKNSMKNKHFIKDLNICKCNDEIDTYIPKTWKSITNMYGDVDTTEVWDNQGKNAKTVFKSKKRNKDKHKFKQQPETNNDLRKIVTKVKSTYPKKKKLVKKSLISLYRKRNKRKSLSNRKDIKADKEQKEIGANVKDKNIRMESPMRFDFFNRIPKLKSYPHHNGTGDSLDPNYYKLQGQNIATEGNNKLDKSLLSNKKENIRDGPRKSRNKNTFLKDSSEKIMTMWSKCNLVKMFFNLHSNKSKNIASSLNEEPLFEMKVDPIDMRVLNSAEINDKLKKLGKIKRKHTCICPSRGKSLKNRRHHVCAKGICENSLLNNEARFDCKCRKRNNILECKDTNCHLKKHTKKNKDKKKFTFLRPSKPQEGQGMPLVEVVLDRNNMNILNSNEMGDMFKNAPYYGICPTGVCKAASKDPAIKVRCKCIAKKMTPMIRECTDDTCVRTMKKCKLSKICSRIFSKSDNWVGFELPKAHGHKQDFINGMQRHNFLTNRNRELVPMPEQHKRQEGPYVNDCECYIKEAEIIKEKVKKEKRKKIKTHNESKPDKINLSLTHNNPTSTSVSNHIIECLKRKHARCENKLKMKEKEFRENEKKAEKENLRIEKMQESNRNTVDPYWNFLTKFISGVLNIGFDLIVKIFSVTFSLLMNPIGSYVYIRERAKDPPGTVKRIKGWLTRTWSNKSSRVSETIKQSYTMNVIADQIEDTAVYDAIFANKGRSNAERSFYERKCRLRKRRIQKRHDQALYGCRHMLLTTLRKTPCLWFYHICPDLYPQCLNLMSFMTNFCHIIIFLLALICWTPCIVCFEGCRAILCCCFCTN